MTDEAVLAPAAPAEAPAEEQKPEQEHPPQKKEKKHKKEHKKEHKKHKKHKHKEREKERERPATPAQAADGRAEEPAAAKRDGGSESGEIDATGGQGVEVRSIPAAGTDASPGAKHGREREEEDGTRKRPRVEDGGEPAAPPAADARPPAVANGAPRSREDTGGRHASSDQDRRRPERSPERFRRERPHEEARGGRRDSDARPSSRPREGSRGRREPERQPSRARDESRARRDSDRHPSRAREEGRARGDPGRPPSRPRDASRARREPERERHASRPRDRPPSRGRDRPPSRQRERSAERRRRRDGSRERGREHAAGDKRRRRSRSAEKEDAEFAAKVIAKLEAGAEDEDALIEERRRKRRELMARLQEEQRLAGAAANPTASELAQAAPAAAETAQPPEPAAAPAAQEPAAPPAQEPAQPSPGPPAPAAPSATAPQPAGEAAAAAESETEDEEGLEETTEDQLFQQRKDGAGEPETAPSPEEPEERHKIRPQAEFDMFAEKPVDDMFADAPVGAPDPAAANAPRRGLLDNYDDSEGYYNFQVGEIMDDRYEVFATHGKGVFSTVLRARDRKPVDEAGRPVAVAPGEWPEVAIKVIRANDLMSKAGQTEVVILRKLAGADPANKYHTIRLLSTFTYRNHLCLVFEPLESNLRQLTKKYGQGIGLRLDAVRSMAAQMLMALHLMRQCGVLHADIKPDNILINKGHNVVKVCDFGSAMFTGNNEITPYLVSRFYRAPEVILGLPYDHPMDVWSVGCVIYELFTGRILFPGRSNNEMLKLMMDVKGPFPKKMLKKGEFAPQHFEDDPAASFCLMELDPLTKRPTKRLIANPTVKKDFKALLAGQEGDPRQVAALVDLLEKMLALDPERRLTAKEALRHPFVRDGRPPPRRRPA